MLYGIFTGFSFDGNRFKVSDLEKLEPKYPLATKDYEEFCQQVAKQISELYPDVSKKISSPHIPRSEEHLKRKIENGGKILATLVANAQEKFNFTKEDIDTMISVGPFPSDFESIQQSLDGLNSYDLEERLNLRSGSIKNLIYNLKDRCSLSTKDIKRYKLTSTK